MQAAQAGIAEFGGGILLTAGFLTPAAAAAVVAVMLVASVSVDIKSGFFAQNGGYEYTLVPLGIRPRRGFVSTTPSSGLKDRVSYFRIFSCNGSQSYS